ncbi:hypothetical protein H0H93_015442 [Arthromyces matolae]|nr:hypothetical protein H0H93_015442 [Arthromyces matolae]
MAPLSCIIVLLSLLAVCIAEIISLKTNSGRTQALAQRSLPEYSFTSSNRDNGPGTNEFDLMDIVLVASVDGKFHALNRTSGNILWSMSSFPSSTSISAPSTLGPLVRTAHVDHDPDLTDETTPQELYVIEPQSGDIYVMSTPTSPLQRFPFTMSELVDMSPFTLPGSEDGRVFVGRKETSLLLIELETGRIKATLNSECAWEHQDDDGELDLDELEESKPPLSTPTEVYIGRTDYFVSIRDTHRNAGPRLPTQNLSFSVYGPNNKDNVLQATYRHTKDDTYIQSTPNGEIIAFKTRAKDMNGQADSLPLWASAFSAPIVATFDVLRKPSSHHSRNSALVLLQPRPLLQDVLPSFTSETRLPNREAAYVGLVAETRSLFAMSPNYYPLVAFGGPERPATVRLIEGSDNRELDDELPTDVDGITKARKYRQQKEAWEREVCSGSAVYTDRRCLVGIRQLEESDGHESRLKRLLDPPADGRYPLPWTGSAQPVEGPNNESVELPRIDAGPPVVGIADSTPNGWGKAMQGNVLEVSVITAILGFLSLWIGLKKFHLSKTKSVANGSVTINGSAKPITEEPLPDTSDISISPGPPSSKLAIVTTLANDLDFDTTPHAPVPVASDDSNTQSQLNGSDPSADNQADESDKDEDPNEDNLATPGKKKKKRGPRGTRGGKKKRRAGINIPEAADDDEERSPPLGGDIDSAEQASPASSLVIQSPKPPPPAPSLVVSETVLESQANFLYIALELCPASLADIVENPDRDEWRDIAIAFEPKKALKEITSGLRHLHALKLVHRDIKPQNILVSAAKPGPGGRTAYRMLISDFGLCKKLDMDQTSFLPTAHGAMAAGTVGWRAPEILRDEVKLDDLSDDHSMSSRGSTGTATGASSTTRTTRLTKSVDIFALGCLYYYTLTNGSHPYGDRFEREVSILKNEKNLEGLQRFGEEGAEAVDLITQMLDPVAQARPDTTTCLLHPFFWDPAKRLNFLQDASDRFEIMCRDPRDPNLTVLETDALAIVGSDWHSRLDKIFIENLGKFRKYDGRSVQDLLRALRNKRTTFTLKTKQPFFGVLSSIRSTAGHRKHRQGDINVAFWSRYKSSARMTAAYLRDIVDPQQCPEAAKAKSLPSRKYHIATSSSNRPTCVNELEKLNFTSLASNLPPEVLQRIFIACAQSAFHIPTWSWSVVTLVCSSWRRTALNCVDLWSYVDFSHPRWTAISLQRSRPVPLSVRAIINAKNQQPVFHTLHYSPMIRDIHIVSSIYDIGPLIGALRNPNPHVQSLVVHVLRADDTNDLRYSKRFPPSSGPPIPYMSYLELHRTPIGLVSPRYINLKTLSLHHLPFSERPSRHDFLSILERFVSLEQLILFHAFPKNAAAGSCIKGPIINLHSLRTMSLTGSVQELTSILECVVVPASSSICCHVDKMDDHKTNFWRLSKAIGSLFHANAHEMPLDAVVMETREQCARFTERNDLNPNFQQALRIRAFGPTSQASPPLDLTIGPDGNTAQDDVLISALTSIWDALPLMNVSTLTLQNLDIITHKSWPRLLHLIPSLRIIETTGYCPNGLFWALLMNARSHSHLEYDDMTSLLLPVLEDIYLHNTDCLAGGFMVSLSRPVNSHCDLDDSRFLDVLSTYLEDRQHCSVPLRSISISQCSGVSKTVLNAIKACVSHLRWDHRGLLKEDLNGSEILRRVTYRNLWPLDPPPSQRHYFRLRTLLELD